MATGTRGRPAIIDKQEINLSDGSSLMMRLVGDGRTVQSELPAKWNLEVVAPVEDEPKEKTLLFTLAPTTSGRKTKPRAPKSVDERACEIDLADGGAVVMSISDKGDSVRFIIPQEWDIDALDRFVAVSGGRTKVTFRTDKKFSASVKKEIAKRTSNRRRG